MLRFMLIFTNSNKSLPFIELLVLKFRAPHLVRAPRIAGAAGAVVTPLLHFQGHGVAPRHLFIDFRTP